MKHTTTASRSAGILLPFLVLILTASSLHGQPQPSVAVEAQREVLVGEPFTFKVTFDNAGDQPGFGPFVLLCLPIEGVDGQTSGPPCDGASFASASAVFSNGKFPLNPSNPPGQIFAPGGGPTTCDPLRAGTDQHPLCAGSLTIPPEWAQCELVVLELPFGSFFPNQPPIEVEVTVDLSQLADVGASLPIYAQGGFRFGDSATGNQCLEGAGAETEVIPSLLRIRKVYQGPEDETATGPSFPRTYNIGVDVADGQTIAPLLLEDRLPDNLQFLVLHPGCTPVSLPNAASPGGTLEVDFGSVTGTSNPVDARCSFDFFVPEADAQQRPVLGDPTCEVTSSDDIRASGQWNPVDPRDGPTATVTSDSTPQDHVLRDLCLAVQKSVVQAEPDLGFPGLTPGDLLEFTLNFQVSDFFELGNLELADVLPDGLDLMGAPELFVPGCAVTFTRGGDLLVLDEARQSCGNGELTLRFLLSEAMVGCPGGPFLTGALIPPSPRPPAQGRITYRARLRDQYYCPGPQDDGFVDKHDVLVNAVEMRGEVHDSESQVFTGLEAKDQSRARVPIPGTLIEKTIVARNGNPNDPLLATSPPVFAPGDTLTFRIHYVLPAGDAESLLIEDFLPSPALDVGEIKPPTLGLCSGVLPKAGKICLGAPLAPVPACQRHPSFATAPDNRFRLSYGDIDDPTNKPCTIEIFVTLTLTDEPFADGLQFTNELVEAEEDSDGQVQQQVVITQFKLGQPELKIHKGVVEACCPEPISPFEFWDDFFLRDLPTSILPDIDGIEPELGTVCGGTGAISASVPFDLTPPGSSGCPRFKGSISSASLGQLAQAGVNGVQPGDRLTFALVIENLGSSPNGAFDVNFSDVLPLENGLEPFGTGLHDINLCVTNGAGAPLPFTSTLTGDHRLEITLEDPPLGGSLGPPDPHSDRNLAVVTYDLKVSDRLGICDCVTNRAEVDSYSGVEGGPDHVDGLDLEIADGAQACRRPKIEKSVAATSMPLTTAEAGVEELTVGEIVRYRLEVVLPEGAMDLSLVDVLPPGLVLAGPTASPGNVAVSVISDRPIPLPGSLMPQTRNTPAGQEVTFDFGPLVNNDSDCGEERLILEFNAQVLNTSDNNAGDVNPNRATVTLSTEAGSCSVLSNTVSTGIVEPRLTMKKTAQLDPNDPQLAHFEIRIQNVGSAPALELELRDLLSECLTGFGDTLLVRYLGRDFEFSFPGLPGFSVDGKTLEIDWIGLLSGDEIVVTFDARLCRLPDCDTTRNSALVTYRSLPVTFAFQNPTGPPLAGGSGDKDGPRDGSEKPVGASFPNDYRATASTGIGGLCDSCIRGVKFEDLDGDGRRDAGEPTLDGWTVHLLCWSPRDEACDAPMVTGPDGRYEFCGLRPGWYGVYEDTLEGWTQTFPGPFLGGWQFVSLGVKEERNDVDFGNRLDSGCIEGTKFEDRNGNGQREPDEPGLEGWTIQAVSQQGIVLGEAVTDDQGRYEICGLPPDRYRVQEVIQAGWQPTAPSSGGVNTGVLAGGTTAGIDFGNRPLTSCIRGVKFHDLNANGLRDPGEPGLAGWRIHHSRWFGLGSDVFTFSRDDGSYEFCELGAGLHFLWEESRPGWQETFPGGTYLVILAQGEQRGDVDFGNLQSTDLELSKRCEEALGRFLGCTIEIRNVGQAAVQPPLVIEDQLPAGFVYFPQGSDPSCVSVSGTSVRCTVDQSLQPGESVSVLVAIQGDPSLAYENCAALVAPSDANPQNNEACVRGAAPFAVEPKIAQARGCDRMGAYNNAVTLHIEGGVGPFECDGPGLKHEVDSRTCTFSVVAGIHTYTVNDNGSGQSKSVEVTLPELIEVVVTKSDPNPTSCLDGTITAQAFGGAPPLNYRITGPNTDIGDDGSAVSVAGRGNGDYTITFFDVQGCRTSRMITLQCQVSRRPGGVADFWIRYGIDGVDQFELESLNRFTFIDLNGDGLFQPNEPSESEGLDGQRPSSLENLELKIISAQVKWRPRAFGIRDLKVRPSVTAEIGEGEVSYLERLKRIDEVESRGEQRASGFLWGIGAAVDLRASAWSQWCVEVAYDLLEASNFDVDESTAVIGPDPAPIFSTVFSRGEMDLRRHRGSAMLGYTTTSGRETFRLGFRRAWYEVDLRTRATFRDQVSLSESRHRENLGVVLVQALLRRGERWLLKSEAGVGPSGWTATLSFGYGFGGRSGSTGSAPPTATHSPASALPETPAISSLPAETAENEGQ